MVYLRSSQAYAYINWDLRNEKLNCFGTSNMPWGTYVNLWSTVYVACHRWINHMSDKASKGLALFTIVLKYAQICLKPRKSATSGADKKSLTSTFTKNECIDLWLEHLKWNNLCHMIVRLGICQKIYTTQFSGERILHTENAKIDNIFAGKKQQKCIIISNLALFWLKLNKI